MTTTKRRLRGLLLQGWLARYPLINLLQLGAVVRVPASRRVTTSRSDRLPNRLGPVDVAERNRQRLPQELWLSEAVTVAPEPQRLRPPTREQKSPWALATDQVIKGRWLRLREIKRRAPVHLKSIRPRLQGEDVRAPEVKRVVTWLQEARKRHCPVVALEVARLRPKATCPIKLAVEPLVMSEVQPRPQSTWVNWSEVLEALLKLRRAMPRIKRRAKAS